MQEAHKLVVPGQRDVFQCGYCQKVRRSGPAWKGWKGVLLCPAYLV